MKEEQDEALTLEERLKVWMMAIADTKAVLAAMSNEELEDVIADSDGKDLYRLARAQLKRNKRRSRCM